MNETIIQQIRSQLPLVIAKVTWTEEVLTLTGEKWHFTTLSAWRLRVERRIVFGCFDSDIREQVMNLQGQVIVDVGPQSVSLPVDPAFVLENGSALEVFSTDTYEPWSMRLPRGPMLVASPSDPKWSDDFEA